MYSKPNFDDHERQRDTLSIWKPRLFDREKREEDCFSEWVVLLYRVQISPRMLHTATKALATKTEPGYSRENQARHWTRGRYGKSIGRGKGLRYPDCFFTLGHCRETDVCFKGHQRSGRKRVVWCVFSAAISWREFLLRLHLALLSGAEPISYSSDLSPPLHRKE